MHSSKLRFRPFRHDDAVAVLDLYNRTVGDRRSLAEWNWEFLEGPGGPSFGWVAEDADEIVAHWAVIPLAASRSGVAFLGGKGELAVTSESHQGRGVFPRLFRQAMGDLEAGRIRVVWSFPNDPLWKVQEWAGFACSQRIRYELLVRRPGRAIRELAERSVARLAAGALALVVDPVVDAMRSVTRRGQRGIDVREIDRFDERFDALWSDVGASLGSTIVRSSAFLRWRFENNPRHRYRTLGVTDPAGALLGYMVISDRMRAGLRVGEISDLVLRPDAGDAVGAMLEHAWGEWSRRDVDIIRFFISPSSPLHASTRRVRKQSGFRFDVQGSRFSVRSFPSSAGDSLQTSVDWHVTAAYTEGFDY